MLAATLAKFAELKTRRSGLFVLHGGIVPFFAIAAL